MSPSGKQGRKCAHCNRDFNSNLVSTLRFVSKHPWEEDEEVVEMSDAIKRIFEWKSNGKKRYKIQKKLPVCHECGICIGKLFGNIAVFDHLKKPGSYVSQAILKEQYDGDVMRYKEEISRRSGTGDADVKIKTISKPVTKITVNNKPSTSSAAVTQIQNFKLVTPEIDDDDVGGYNDLAMMDDEDSDPDFIPVEIKTDVKQSRMKSEGDTFILGVDETPPSPRAADAPIIDLENKAYLCQLCPKGFGTNQGLRTHLLLTHEIGNKAKEHVCTHCGKAYFYDYLLKNHAKVHTEERPITCPICPSKFKSKLALNHHQKNVHEANDRPFKCEMCEKSYKEARSLREHVNITHNAIGPVFQCKFGCGSTTSRKRSMLSHYRRCRMRPGAENDPPRKRRGRAAGSGRGRGGRSGSTRGRGGGGARGKVELPDKSELIACKWDCGKFFKDKRQAMRHNVYNCTKRPHKQKPHHSGISLQEPKTETPEYLQPKVEVIEPMY